MKQKKTLTGYPMKNGKYVNMKSIKFAIVQKFILKDIHG